MAKTKKTFEDYLYELENIVSKLENDEFTLDESIEMFGRGIELSKLCSQKLEQAEKKISILIEDEKGVLKERLFDLSEE